VSETGGVLASDAGALETFASGSFFFGPRSK